ncbi:MAG: hypothetical protein WC220_06640 [Pedobacter sp.]
MESFKLDIVSELIHLIKEQTVATFNQLTKGREDEYMLLQKQLNELNQRIMRLKERFITEDINRDLYLKYSEKYNIEKKEFEDNLMKASNRVPNLEECVEKAINFSSKLPSKWTTADYTTKQQIQFLFFPEGIRYNKKIDKCRTTRVNSVFAYIAHLKQDLSQQKRGIPELNLDYASL